MKKYIIFAGVNGAGKSTLYMTNPVIENMPRVNVDEIVRSIGDWRNIHDVAKAGKMAVAKLEECFRNGVSVNQETTLCGKGIIKNIRRAKELGYSVEMYYVGLDSADTAKRRIKERVKNGGHGIPDEDVERRYKESFSQLKKVLPMCDVVSIYDNTFSFKRIADFRGGKLISMSPDSPQWFMELGIVDF